MMKKPCGDVTLSGAKDPGICEIKQIRRSFVVPIRSGLLRMTVPCFFHHPTDVLLHGRRYLVHTDCRKCMRAGVRPGLQILRASISSGSVGSIPTHFRQLPHSRCIRQRVTIGQQTAQAQTVSGDEGSEASRAPCRRHASCLAASRESKGQATEAQKARHRVSRRRALIDQSRELAGRGEGSSCP
jgi:hypothetical protein